PESPTWSVKSLLLPPAKYKGDINVQDQQEVKITQHEFLSLLKMARLQFSNSSILNDNSFNNKKSDVKVENNKTSNPQIELNKDISILCNFVRHVQSVDVSNIEPLRSFWTTEVEIGLRNEDVTNICDLGKVDENERDMRDYDEIKKENILLK
ncbi:136_t:CDS:1, partial [Racocetra fulgida]